MIMKKIFTLIIALGTLSTVFAQSGRHNDYNRSNGYNGNSYSQPSYQGGHYDNRGGHDAYNAPNYDRNRQVEIDRINHDYDGRIDAFRRDRSLSTYERDRRIDNMQRERDQKLKLIGGGLIVGGIIALLAGSH